MVIQDCVKVIGRGTILICELPDILFEYVDDFAKIPKCNIGDLVYLGGNYYYQIKGIEKIGNMSNKVGFIIYTNEDIDFFKNKEFSLLCS